MLSQLADAERLNYIEAVTHETMRLKPVAPVLFLESIEDVEIGGVAVPKANRSLPAHVARRLAGRTLWRGGRIPAGTLARSGTGFGLSAQCQGVRSLSGPVRVSVRAVNWRMVEIKTVMAMLCAGFEVSKTDSPNRSREIFSFTMMPENLFVRFKRWPRKRHWTQQDGATSPHSD